MTTVAAIGGSRLASGRFDVTVGFELPLVSVGPVAGWVVQHSMPSPQLSRCIILQYSCKKWSPWVSATSTAEIFLSISCLDHEFAIVVQNGVVCI